MGLCPANIMRTTDRGFACYTRYAPNRHIVVGCLSLRDAPSDLMAALDWRQTQAGYITWLAQPQSPWAQPITVQFQQADLSLYPELSRTTSGSSTESLASETGNARPTVSITSTLALSTTTTTSSQDTAGVKGDDQPWSNSAGGSDNNHLRARYAGRNTDNYLGSKLAACCRGRWAIARRENWAYNLARRSAKAKIAYENLAAERDGKPITEKDGKEIIGELPGDRGTRPPVEMEA
ncbi:hypothetical protein W97_00063 [Coniosporium apollinis CBS 100218]|uniref:Uncharacterized protein n=1 Tax=Coniosporium apollinis (strain CBS 100218) TaxID=1168221 RepID=R7YG39_CONA1|nr:uncharacterized protein W97_00063 [Coniosporium apollinis CBS 100218]EON60853.1 hypothetical protein W97_00063 [Coniosporium apollinis CBS 100218]